MLFILSGCTTTSDYRIISADIRRSPIQPEVTLFDGASVNNVAIDVAGIGSYSMNPRLDDDRLKLYSNNPAGALKFNLHFDSFSLANLGFVFSKAEEHKLIDLFIGGGLFHEWDNKANGIMADIGFQAAEEDLSYSYLDHQDCLFCSGDSVRVYDRSVTLSPRLYWSLVYSISYRDKGRLINPLLNVKVKGATMINFHEEYSSQLFLSALPGLFIQPRKHLLLIMGAEFMTGQIVYATFVTQLRWQFRQSFISGI